MVPRAALLGHVSRNGRVAWSCFAQRGSHLALAALCSEVECVVAVVGPERDPAFAGRVLVEHLQGVAPLRSPSATSICKSMIKPLRLSISACAEYESVASRGPCERALRQDRSSTRAPRCCARRPTLDENLQRVSCGLGPQCFAATSGFLPRCFNVVYYFPLLFFVAFFTSR
jgi:hypothetical protein